MFIRFRSIPVSSRRSFIKSAVASAVLLQVASCSTLSSNKKNSFETVFDNNRAPSKNREPLTERESYNVLSHGAVGDGRTLNTDAIQNTINLAAKNATGGRIVFPQGKYLSGSLFIPSNIELHLEKNAVLLGSTNVADYEDARGLQHFLNANGSENIALSGDGTIDAQGRELVLNIDFLHHSGERIDPNYNVRRRRPRSRPEAISFHYCKNVKIYDVTIKNSASWVQHYAGCFDLTIDNIKVESDTYWNNDGIDINNCKKVRITNSFVNAADDAICLKSKFKGKNGFFNEDIYIADCVLRSSSNALKFGTESQGGFKNVVIKNIKVFDTYRSAIAIETVDGAYLENVEVSNIEADNVGNAIFIRLGQRNMKVDPNTPVSYLRNIKISNVTAKVSFLRADANYEVRGPALNKFFNPIPASIVGLPDAHIENVTLENINISYPGRGNKGIAYVPLEQLFLVPEERAGYPEYTMFGELPSWGLFVRHVDGLVLKNINVSARHSDFRPAFVFDNVKNVQLINPKIKGQGADEQIVFNNVSHASVKGPQYTGGTTGGVLELGNNQQISVQSF